MSKVDGGLPGLVTNVGMGLRSGLNYCSYHNTA